MRLSKAVPTHIKPANPKHLEMHRVEPLSNGILRAHVVKAEACLQIAVLYLLQENISGYIKCGLNLRRGTYTLYEENICLILLLNGPLFFFCVQLMQATVSLGKSTNEWDNYIMNTLIETQYLVFSLGKAKKKCR